MKDGHLTAKVYDVGASLHTRNVHVHAHWHGHMHIHATYVHKSNVMASIRRGSCMKRCRYVNATGVCHRSPCADAFKYQTQQPSTSSPNVSAKLCGGMGTPVTRSKPSSLPHPWRPPSSRLVNPQSVSRLFATASRAASRDSADPEVQMSNPRNCKRSEERIVGRDALKDCRHTTPNLQIHVSLTW